MSVKKASPYNVDDVRDDFPVLGRTVDGEELVYLDNAATSQKPEEVIDSVCDFVPRVQRKRSTAVLHTLKSGGESRRTRARTTPSPTSWARKDARR